MKKKLLYVLFSIFLLSGCSKEYMYNKVPEGLYECWFTDEGESAYYVPLYLFKTGENTLVFTTSTEATYGPFVKVDRQYIGGTVDGKSCIGKISRKNGKYIFSGTYSYLNYSGGLGNPNPTYYKVNGTFKFTSN